MNTRLFEAFSELDPDLIDRSERPTKHKRRLTTSLLAAAALLAVAVALALPHRPTPDPVHTDTLPVVKNPMPSTPPTDGLGQTDPAPTNPTLTEEPPVLHFNETVSDPTGNVLAFEETPMSAWQLELSWSMDCPTAFLGPGDPERWIYSSNLSGNFLWNDDGTLRGLRLIYRREKFPIPALVTVTAADRPLDIDCFLPEEMEESVFGPIRCVAWRLELGETVRLGADFTIGDVLYSITTKAVPEDEADAELVLYTAVSVMQRNALVGRTPDLTSFNRDDPTSGRLTGENAQLLLSLSRDREEDGSRVLIYRDGRVVYLRPGLTEGDAIPLGTLSHGTFWELRAMLEEARTNEGDGVLLTLFDPWGREAGHLAGPSAEHVADFLTREGVMPPYELW